MCREPEPEPAVEVRFGRATLTAGRLPRFRSDWMVQLPVAVEVGLAADGLVWWVGELGADGWLLPRYGSWRSATGWEWVRIRVSEGPPTELRVVRAGEADTVLLAHDADAAQVREAINRFAPEALRGDDPSRPEVNWDDWELESDPIEVEVSEEPDEPGELLIGFSDEIAHDHRSLVLQSVDVVRAIPGIRRADQTDTEVITAYGSASAEEVKAVLHTWWDGHLPGWRDMH
jgi:hypothetical protein